MELLNNLSRFEVEGCQHGAFDYPFVDRICAKCIDVHAQRVGMPDCVSELYFAFSCQPRGNHSLRHPAPHVSRTAIDFAWIFSRKSAAAAAPHSAVGINAHCAATQAGVALWA